MLILQHLQRAVWVIPQNARRIVVHTYTHLYIPHTPIHHFSSYFIATFSFSVQNMVWAPKMVVVKSHWVGGIACSVQSATCILGEVGPHLKDRKKGEVILLDGGFPGRKHGIIPYPLGADFPFNA